MSEYPLRTAEQLSVLLQAFRKESGLTQSEVALRLGVTQQTYSTLERNAESVGVARLLKLQLSRHKQLLREREAVLKKAQESEERYRRLVELSPHGISVHAGGKFQFINRAGAEMLGAGSCDELVGREVLDFVHPHYHQVFQERLLLLEESQVDLPWLEEKFLRCDGSELNVEVTALPFSSDREPAFQTLFRDITYRKASERRLERMANYDLLTGLPNRGFFFDRLNQLMLQAKRDGAMFALLYIDLDRFKEVNDLLGQYYGDLLLKEVASRLTCCVRESDTVARMGGDEFVVIISKIRKKADAAGMASRLGEAIGRPFEIQDRLCRLGASIGISLYPDDGESIELQLVKADTAMYRSKKLGRNDYQFYGSGSDQPAECAQDEPPSTCRQERDGGETGGLQGDSPTIAERKESGE